MKQHLTITDNKNSNDNDYADDNIRNGYNCHSITKVFARHTPYSGKLQPRRIIKSNTRVLCSPKTIALYKDICDSIMQAGR